MSRVTIVTPTYRHSRFIGQCITSVLNQTVTDWDMTIVDDGSDDGTADLAESLADSRITVCRRPHRGQSALGESYAIALTTSASPFVAVLEGDDAWPATKLEEQLPLMSDDGVVLVYGPAGLIDEHGCVYAHHTDAPRGTTARNDPLGSIMPALVRTDFIVTSTVLLRRSTLDQVGGFVQPAGIPYVDVPTWLRLATVGRFARSESTAGYWRRHSDQWTMVSAFEPTPDRTAYLMAAARAAERVLRPRDRAALYRAIGADSKRQRDEAAIARARLSLVAGEWSQATRQWLALVMRGQPRSRAVAAAGVACALAHTDIEWAIRAAGRHAYPSRRHRISHRAAP